MDSTAIVWQVGDHVLHKDYGVGTVLQVDPSNNTFHYLVSFPEQTKKWFPLWNNRDVLRKLSA